jgi:hypothetical protein
MTPKYFVDQIRALLNRIVNVESRLPVRLRATFTPTDSLSAGAYVVLSVTVPNAAVGDLVIVSPVYSGGSVIQSTAAVTAANTVSVVVRNIHASAISILAGTWSVTILK